MYRDYVELPEEVEQQMNDLADHVSKQLFFRPDIPVKFEFLDVHYELFGKWITSKDFKRVFALTAIDRDQGMKIHMLAEASNSFSDQENLRTIVDTFLRNRSGLDPQVEELEDE